MFFIVTFQVRAGALESIARRGLLRPEDEVDIEASRAAIGPWKVRGGGGGSIVSLFSLLF